MGEGGKEREGGERPPSLGSQPLNQALSHPVNLKQSGFNSSCLSAPTLAKSEEAHGAEARSASAPTRRTAQTGLGRLQRTHQQRHTQSLYPLLRSSFLVL